MLSKNAKESTSTTRRCRDCGKELPRPKGRGRPPVRCQDCTQAKAKAKKEVATEEVRMASRILREAQGVNLRLSEVKPDPRNPRGESQDVKSMAKSILTHGLLNPPLIDQDNVLVTGHRRFYAIRDHLAKGRLHGGTLPKHVREKWEGDPEIELRRVRILNDGHRLQVQVADEFGHVFWDEKARGRAIVRLHEGLGVSLEQIAEQSGNNPSYIREIHSTFKLADVARLAQEKQVSTNKATKLKRALGGEGLRRFLETHTTEEIDDLRTKDIEAMGKLSDTKKREVVENRISVEAALKRPAKTKQRADLLADIHAATVGLKAINAGQIRSLDDMHEKGRALSDAITSYQYLREVLSELDIPRMRLEEMGLGRLRKSSHFPGLIMSLGEGGTIGVCGLMDAVLQVTEDSYKDLKGNRLSEAKKATLAASEHLQELSHQLQGKGGS